MNPEFCANLEMNESLLKSLSRLYGEVFGAPPWNEVWRCSTCDRFYGPEYQQDNVSPCCSTPLTMAYPEKETINYIIEELSSPRAQIRLLYLENNKLVAFAWSYQIANAKSLAEKKWPQSTETQNKVIEAIKDYTDPNLPLYYISEIGVAYPFRGNQIGFRLTSDLVNFGLDLGEIVIFRTNYSSPMMRIAEKLMMRQIMGPKVDKDLITTREITGFLDQVNPNRTLFIKTK